MKTKPDAKNQPYNIIGPNLVTSDRSLFIPKPFPPDRPGLNTPTSRQLTVEALSSFSDRYLLIPQPATELEDLKCCSQTLYIGVRLRKATSRLPGRNL